jgi:hypothetical protein
MNRWRVGEDRGSKETDGCPLTVTKDPLPCYASDHLYYPPTLTSVLRRECSTVRATLTVLVNSSHSRSSQGKSKVNIYTMRGVVYNTCLARGNPKRTL